MSMNSSEIFGVIERIAATSSKNEKQQIIEANSHDETFRRVLFAALDPFTNYGIQKLPARTQPGAGLFSEQETWKLLSDLSARVLTGNAAREALQEEINRLEEASSELLKRIIIKDLKANFGENSVNKAIKGLIKDFPYMRCSLPKDAKFEEWDWAGGVISQEKADGMFCNADYDEFDVVTFTSRQGSPFPMDAFTELVADFKKHMRSGTQTHGELLVLVDGEIAERAIGNGILNRVLKGGEFLPNEKPILKVWDQIPLSAVTPKGRFEVGYEHRLVSLYKQLPLAPKEQRYINVIETRVVRSMKDAYAHYKDLLKKGKEGTIVKKRDAKWVDATSKEQVKLKLEVTVDLKVVAIVPGKENGKNAGRAGSLTCETSCGNLRVDVAVKNEDMRSRIDADADDWIGRILPVTCNEIIEPSESNEMHSLFLPRAAEADYRMDKTEADTLEQVYGQFEAAVEAA